MGMDVVPNVKLKMIIFVQELVLAFARKKSVEMVRQILIQHSVTMAILKMEMDVAEIAKSKLALIAQKNYQVHVMKFAEMVYY